MIRHIVLTRFRPDVSEDTIAAIYVGLAGVSSRLPGAQNFGGGRSESPEQIERGYMHGFTIDFDGWAALQALRTTPNTRALAHRSWPMPRVVSMAFWSSMSRFEVLRC